MPIDPATLSIILPIATELIKTGASYIKKNVDERKEKARRDRNNLQSDLSVLSSVIGQGILSTSVRGSTADPVASTFGGALAGVPFGPIGVIGGGLAGLITGLKGVSDYREGLYQDEMDLYTGKGFEPMSFRKGGIVGMTPVQTEEGESALLSTDGSIVKIASKKKHKNMDPAEVTDMLPIGTVIFPNKKLPKRAYSDITLTPPSVYYSERKTYKIPSLKMSDVLDPNKEYTYSDAVMSIRRKIRTVPDDNDLFNIATNEANKSLRMLYMMPIMNELMKTLYRDGMISNVGASDQSPSDVLGGDVGVPMFQEGGIVPKLPRKKISYVEPLNKDNIDLPSVKLDTKGVGGYGDVTDIMEPTRTMIDDIEQVLQERERTSRELVDKGYRLNLLHGIGAIGSDLLFNLMQDTRYRPFIADTTFIDKIYRPIAPSVVESQISRLRSGFGSAVRDLFSRGYQGGLSGISGMYSKLLDAESKIRSDYLSSLTDLRQKRYSAYRGVRTGNLQRQIQAERARQKLSNKLLSNVGSVVGSGITKLGDIRYNRLKALMNLQDKSIENRFALSDLRREYDLLDRLYRMKQRYNMDKLRRLMDNYDILVDILSTYPSMQ